MRQLYLLLAFVLLGMSPLAVLAQKNALPIYFANGTTYLPLNFDSSKTQVVAPGEISEGKYARYIQVAELPSDQTRMDLERQGVVFEHYVDQNAYLVLIPEGFDLAGFSTLKVQSIVAPRREWKMSNTLTERPFGAWAVSSEGIEVVVQLYSHVSIARGAVILANEGYTVLQRGIQNGFLRLRVPEAQLEALAMHPAVAWAELTAQPSEKEDTQGRSYHRTNMVDSDHPLGRKYNGTGVNTLVRDDGALGPHIDFQGRLLNQPGIDDPYVGTHGDGVGGIIGSAGNLDPTKKGMATGANVYVLDYTAEFQDNTMVLVQQENVTVTNSSYSNGCNVGYTTAARTVDQQVFANTKLMHVFSAGNSNGSDCGYGAGTQWGNITGGHKIGKNVIATANLDANGDLAASSSRGPVKDGRIKPDISAHGAGQLSNDPDNAYQVFGGTSAASPGIAGCVAQLTHAYRTINNETQAPTALLKAALMNTANEMGNIGPDFKYGWGHVNNFRALRLLEQHNYQTATVSTGATNNITLTIPSGVAQAKIMLYWADPAGTTTAAKALVNDLDLTVLNSSNTVFRPWKLNPTPNATILDTPAGKGRDSLNNAEQVVIDNPAAGTYTIAVKGFSVPMGPQSFYVCWDFLDNGVQLTYPAGGEGLVPGTVEKVRWDALGNSGTFDLKYSVNGGAYQTITTVAADKRTYDWTVPSVVNGNVRFAIVRGTRSDTTDYPFTICPLPANFKVAQACADSLQLSWTKVNTTLAYEVFQLGAKYMEPILVTAPGAEYARIPNTYFNSSQWFSVRAVGANGLVGRRAIAVRYQGGLLNCLQDYDLTVEAFIQPADTNLVVCADYALPITVRIFNQGKFAVSQGKISMQVGSTVFVDSLPTIPAGTTYTFTFDTLLTLTQSGIYPIKVKIFDVPGEISLGDNERSMSLRLTVAGSLPPFDEGFETALLPVGWNLGNPDNGLTWKRYQNLVTGANGQPTLAMFMDHYSYSGSGQLDYLYTPPANIGGFDLPYLEFDYTHSMYNASYTDGLRVELLRNCGADPDPVVLWEKIDPELADTVMTSEYYPTWAGQWNRVSIPLADYAQSNFLIRFVAINGFGNSTFLDNVALRNYPKPTATVQAPASTCQDAPVTIAADETAGQTYTWLFGAGATPSTATGAGPHEVQFAINGQQNIRLIVANAYGSDTLEQNLQVLQSPVAAITFTANQLVHQFTAIAPDATTYLWDFGDGTTSTEANPTHTYTDDGPYVVELTASNACGSSSAIQALVVISAPQAAFTVSANQGCAPYSVMYTSTASANATSLQWSFPGGTPSSSTLQNQVVFYSVPGTYTATLTASNSVGSSTFSNTDPVVVQPQAQAGFTFLANVLAVQYSNTSQNATTYLWNFGDGNTSTEAEPNHEYTSAGTYTVTLTATNDCGANTTTQSVTVTTAPQAGFTVSSSQGCAPFTVQYTNTTSANATAFLWAFPGGTPATSTQPSPVVVYSAPGTYTATLTASNSAGSSTYTAPVAVEVITVPTAAFSAASNGATAAFSNESQNATQYVWNFGDGNTSTVANPQHTYANDGTYTVVLSATNACGTVTATQTVTISTPPTAAYTTSTGSGCAPFTVQYTNASSSNATAFEWVFPGGTPSSSNLPNPVVIYSLPGTYTATLTASNNVGSNTFTATDEVVVSTVPFADFDVLVIGATVVMTNSSADATTYLWDFGDGTTSTEANTDHFYTTDGTYFVTLTATNACGSSTAVQTVQIVTPPTAAFVVSGPVGCAPFTVTYDNTSSLNTTSIVWSFPGGTPATSTIPSPTVTYNTPGTYTATLTASNSAGTSTVTGEVVVIAAPTAAYTASVFDNAVVFNNLSTGADSYLWDFGDGNTSTEEAPTHTYTSDGVYTVTLSATNDCGTVVTEQTVVIITPLVAGFVATPGTGCTPNLTVQFNNTSTANATSFLWAFPGGQPATSTEVSPVVVYGTGGSFPVTLTAMNANDTVVLSLPDAVVVQTPPDADFLATANGLAVAFNNLSSGGVTYAWDFGDGSTSNEASPVHTYVAPGTYIVTLSVTNACGVTQQVQTLVLTSGVWDGNVPQLQVKALPNPNNGQFDLQITGWAGEQIQVHAYNALGQMVYTQTLNGAANPQRHRIDLGDVPAGPYWLRVRSEKGEGGIKVVKE